MAYELATDPYCKICDKRLSSYSNFKSHNLAVHGENNGGEFICTLCDGHFTTEFHLTKHRYRQHPEEFPQLGSPQVDPSKTSRLSENPYASHECIICKRPFKNFCGYYAHIRAAHKDAEWEKSFRPGYLVGNIPNISLAKWLNLNCPKLCDYNFD